MDLDVARRFDDILDQGSTTFKQRILNASQYQISRVQTNQWASHLRFLSSTSFQEQSDGLCTLCSKCPPFSPTERALRLTRPAKAGNCRHYIAVSYCWQHGSGKNKAALNPYYIFDGKNTRLNKAPHEILARAISFALTAIGHHLIWIDQECIDQDDRNDKEFGIQSMDQVYHRASLSLGLLNTIIETQLEMDALVTLYERRSFGTKEEMLAGVALMHRLSQDRWYNRSWIFQESSLSLNLILLIRHAPSVRNPLGQGILGEVKISFTELHRCATTISKILHNPTRRPLLDELRQIEEIEWWAASSFPEIKTPGFSTKRFACSAAETLHHLEFRKNSRTADRLAIIANLCHYHTRLDTTILNAKETSFSICLLALSVLNGDTSLLLDYLPGTLREREILKQRMWGRDSSRYSWTAPLLSRMVRRGGWRSSSYLNGFDPNMRLQLSELSPVGLLTSGWIWKVDRLVDLRCIKIRFHQRWEDCQRHPDTRYYGKTSVGIDTHDEDAVQELGSFSSQFIVETLQELASQRLNAVVAALWRLVQPLFHKQWGQNWIRCCKNPEWRRALYKEDPNVMAEQFLDDAPIPPLADYLQNPTMKARLLEATQDCWRAPANLCWLFDQVTTDGFIYCGHLLQGVEPMTPEVIFDCSEPIYVFAPYAEEVCPVTGPVQPRINPISWVVDPPAGPVDGCVHLQCTGVVQGIWERAAVPPEKVYLC